MEESSSIRSPSNLNTGKRYITVGRREQEIEDQYDRSATANELRAIAEFPLVPRSGSIKFSPTSLQIYHLLFQSEKNRDCSLLEEAGRLLWQQVFQLDEPMTFAASKNELTRNNPSSFPFPPLAESAALNKDIIPFEVWNQREHQQCGSTGYQVGEVGREGSNLFTGASTDVFRPTNLGEIAKMALCLSESTNPTGGSHQLTICPHKQSNDTLSTDQHTLTSQYRLRDNSVQATTSESLDVPFQFPIQSYVQPVESQQLQTIFQTSRPQIPENQVLKADRSHNHHVKQEHVPSSTITDSNSTYLPETSTVTGAPDSAGELLRAEPEFFDRDVELRQINTSSQHTEETSRRKIEEGIDVYEQDRTMAPGLDEKKDMSPTSLALRQARIDILNRERDLEDLQFASRGVLFRLFHPPAP